MTKEIREQDYEILEWEDRVIDEETEEVLVEGTPVNEINMNRIEAALTRALYDLGLANAESIQVAHAVAGDIDKYKNQRLLQGQATITSDGEKYFHDGEYPYTLVELPEDSYAQLNAPDYDVLINIVDADDIGAVGELIPFDKAENGFKVKMTGSAQEVTFKWTLINPRIA